jgi:uncharacterized protein
MFFCFLFDSIIGKFKTSKVKQFNIIPKTVNMSDYQASSNIKKKAGVLITGGSGVIGKYLTRLLLESGYSVSHLSRGKKHTDTIKVFRWDPQTGLIDRDAFEGIDFLIHLAGANVGAKRWTRKRKEEIIESRSGSAHFLHKTIIKEGVYLKAFISASATGYYGSVTSDRIFTEKDPPADDFLGKVCKLWEESADLFHNSGIRTVKIRTAVVLEKNDSVLSRLMIPGRFGFLIKAGKGRQFMPWIHIDDLCNVYLRAIEDSAMSGAYNAVAPCDITHADFIRILGRIMSLPVLTIPVNGFLSRLLLGERSDLIFKGSRVSAEKLLLSGYRYLYGEIENALISVIRGQQY